MRDGQFGQKTDNLPCRIQYRDWEKAFFDVIPKRKFDEKSRKQKRKEARAQAGLEGSQTPDEQDDVRETKNEGEVNEEGLEAEEEDGDAEIGKRASSAKAASVDSPQQAIVQPPAV